MLRIYKSIELNWGFFFSVFQVDWTEETACFASITHEIALFYQVQPGYYWTAGRAAGGAGHDTPALAPTATTAAAAAAAAPTTAAAAVVAAADGNGEPNRQALPWVTQHVLYPRCAFFKRHFVFSFFLMMSMVLQSLDYLYSNFFF